MDNLWQATCAETFSSTPLSGKLFVDLVIVGGGFTGCAAALEAASNGAKVVLLEAHAIGHGGSGRNVGLVNAGLWLPPDQVEAQMGQAAGQRLNTALAAAPDQVFSLIAQEGISCEAVRNGTLHCAHAPRGMRDLQARYDQQRQRNAPVHLLDARAAQAKVGSALVHGALQDHRAGTIQPLSYVKGLARAAQAKGARLFEGSPVLSCRYQDGHWIVQTKLGEVQAAKLLITGNAYAEGASAQATPQTSIVHYFQIATEPMEARLQAEILPELQGCWDTGLVMKSFRRDAGGRLIFGAMGLPDRVGLHRAWAERKLGRMFPALADAKLQGFWSGRIAMTSDHLPKVIALGDNGYCIFGYSGRGIGPGTVFGRTVAQALLQGETQGLPVAPVAAYRERFCWSKSAYYEAGARLVHLTDR